MRVALYGAGGKVGAVLLPALVEAGHEVVDARSAGPEGCDVAIDFTRPDAVGANVDACLAAGTPSRDRHERVRRPTPWTRLLAAPACRASTPRTSRSGPP